tara:strand:- start:30629 stop:32215 length:1587 start_codon:yes stop_codon:yes gene_type:complete
MSEFVLSEDILNTIKGYTDGMKQIVSIVLNTGEHEKRTELFEFLRSVSASSDKIIFEERDLKGDARSPLTFVLEVEGDSTGIYFSGIPSGHEFNSFILALLQSGGVPIKLDDGIKKVIENIEEKLSFEIFVSLSCHNCPEVVQAINQFALLNSKITSEMVDGGLFQNIINERKIQGVPSVYLNGDLFANGRVELSSLIEKLNQYSNNRISSDDNIPLQDVVIIGGGPAGISSAIYAARKGFKVSLIAEKIGGQVKDTLGIENLISVSSTTGPDLTQAMKSHMNDYNVTVKEHLSVVSLKDDLVKKIELSSGEIIKSRSIIIATGANWRELGVPGEKENMGNGVAYCPHCDGPFFKGKDVAVVGGGNSGIEASIDLSGIVKSVTVFEFLAELKADQVLIDQVKKRDNINIITNVDVQEILSSNGKVTGVQYRHRDTNEVQIEDLSGVFVQIGLVPNSNFLKGVIDLNQYGEIIVDDYCNTSASGVFACGDVTTVPYKQIVIAMGEGSKAAIAAAEYLQKNSIEVISAAE